MPHALQHDIELEFDAPARALPVLGDETLLRELLNNLLDNAIRYGRHPGLVSIQLEAEPTPLLVVEDDGPGIPQDEMDKVFERFYRIPGSPSDGCGLGLAIVKEIASLHGAQLRLTRSVSRGGLRIEVAFPALGPHGVNSEMADRLGDETLEKGSKTQ